MIFLLLRASISLSLSTKAQSSSLDKALPTVDLPAPGGPIKTILPLNIALFDSEITYVILVISLSFSNTIATKFF